MTGLSNEGIAALIGSIGAVAAAIIGGFVAFITLIVNKEQSVSAFRQDWIDALRNDIAELIAHVIGAHGTSITQKRYSDQQLWDRIKADFVGLNQTVVRIKLRLNPKECRTGEKQATQNVFTALDGIIRVFERDTPDFTALRSHTDNLVNNSQVVLKQNWNRVRSGERGYVLTKRAALCVASLGFLASLAYLAIRLVHH